MHTNMDKHRGKMAEKRITQEELAEKIGIDPSTFYRKMKTRVQALLLDRCTGLQLFLIYPPLKQQLFFVVKLAFMRVFRKEKTK